MLFTECYRNRFYKKKRCCSTMATTSFVNFTGNDIMLNNTFFFFNNYLSLISGIYFQGCTCYIKNSLCHNNTITCITGVSDGYVPGWTELLTATLFCLLSLSMMPSFCTSGVGILGLPLAFICPLILFEPKSKTQ